MKKKKIIFFMILIFVILGFVYAYGKVNSYAYEPINLTDEELGIVELPTELDDLEAENDEKPYKKKNPPDIINIALFGLDRRSSSEQMSRSDAIMIATIDFKHNKIKLSSLMRDQAVYIDGYGLDKLNHAYAYGGEELAIKTINQNFGLNIRDYATVDFFMLAKLIDSIGGVDIDIEEIEIAALNKNLHEISSDSKDLNEVGIQRLTGSQAVAYSRIRSVGDGDFERTERQRKVLTAMLNEAKNIAALDLPIVWTTIAPNVQTSLSITQILEIGTRYLSAEDMTLEQMRFPLEWESDILPNGSWVMSVDLNVQKETMQNYLFNDVSPIGDKIVVDENDLKTSD